MSVCISLRKRYSSSSETSTFVKRSSRESKENLSHTRNTIMLSTLAGLYGMYIAQRLFKRARRIIRGSANDIGWLQQDPDRPPVEDRSERFNEILEDIRHGLHTLPRSVVYLFVPGLFSNHGPLYFVSTQMKFSEMGLTCHIAKIDSEASVEDNAREIKECIEKIYWNSKKCVLLLGHSKGGVDAAAALSLYWSDLQYKVVGLVLAQSPYGGNPIASDILREGQFKLRKLVKFLFSKVMKGNIEALKDLTYEKRKEFLKKHPLPRELPVVSFRTEANISPTALTTLSHIANVELHLEDETTNLPVVIPIGAAMVAIAWLLKVRYREKNDGLVTCRDAEVPGSVVVRPKFKLDHAWMVYSSLNDDSMEFDASQVCEALLLMVVELAVENH